MKYNKVIIWGHRLHSHTHSYVHESYKDAFEFLGYKVYRFYDDEFPSELDFDYSNSLFIAEGFADKNIPINDSSCYLVMYCPSPVKYANAGRYIDVRMAAVNFKDHIQEYSIDKDNYTKIGPACYFVPKSTVDIVISNNYHNYRMPDFDKLYISWATNLLPHEINLDWITLPRENNIWYCGTISNLGECENLSTFQPFIDECNKSGIVFQNNNPWTNPLSFSEAMHRVQSSILGVDIRGPKHIQQKLLTCRVFKNISYGHLGITNSKAIYEELDGLPVYNTDTAALFHDAMSERGNKKRIIDSMLLVKEKHTYINRVQSILSIL